MSAADRWRWLLKPGSGHLDGLTTRELYDAVALVAEAVPGAVASSITELDDQVYRTSVASSRLALELDIAQYTSGAGPCMTAARDRQKQQVRDTSSSSRFGAFAAAAERHAVRSSLSIPIRTADHPAALNIYSRDLDGFDERGRAVADLLARALTARLVGSSGSRPMSMAESVGVAQRRALIFAAQEADNASTPSEAFESLARRSAREGRSVFDIATDLIEKRVGLT